MTSEETIGRGSQTPVGLGYLTKWSRVVCALLLSFGVAAAWGQKADGRAHELDRRFVERAVERARGMERLHGLLVSHRGERVVEEVFSGPALNQPVNIKSVSKTIIAALVGIAIDRGIIQGVDQAMTELLGDRVPGDATSGVDEITVGNLLSLQAGLQRTSGPYYGRWVNSEDWVAHVLTRPFVAEPGGDLLYSTGSTHLLSAALTEASGRTTLELAREWLGMPLNIRIPEWPQDPQGIYFGGNQMLLSPLALLAFGEMYRRGGTAASGERVLPEEWIEKSWQPRGRSPFTEDLYGYGWFINEIRGEAVYAARGFGGQVLYLVPGLELTVVLTASTEPPGPGAIFLKALDMWLEDTLIAAARKG